MEQSTLEEEISKLKSTDRKVWVRVSRYPHLPLSFIRDFHEKILLDELFSCRAFLEVFIREIVGNKKFKKDSIFWFTISKSQDLSEGFIREYQNEVNWGCISAYQNLSEDFIREFKDRVNWFNISFFQILSQPFIEEFKDRLDLKSVDIEHKSRIGSENGGYRIEDPYTGMNENLKINEDEDRT